MNVWQKYKGILLPQDKYANNLIKKFKKGDCKQWDNPMDPGTAITED
jgi:hypothetical protein